MRLYSLCFKWFLHTWSRAHSYPKPESMMFKPGQYITLFYYKIIYKLRSRREKVSIHDILNQADHVLLCLPNDKSGIHSLISKADRFQQIFPRALITVFNPSTHLIEDRLDQNFRIVESAQNRLTIWGQLARSIKSALVRHHYQVAIDLSRSFQYENTVAVCLSKATLRISFDHPKKTRFYNFVIRVSQQQNWDACLNTLCSFLRPKSEQTLKKRT